MKALEQAQVHSDDQHDATQSTWRNKMFSFSKEKSEEKSGGKPEEKSRNKQVNQRRRLFVMPRYQGIFLVQMLILVGFIGLMMYLVSYYFFTAIFERSVQFGLGDNINFMRYLLDVHSLLVFALFIAFGLTTLVVLLYALYHSHRIAGPIYKLKLHMQQAIAENRFDELKFRKDDYFHELAEVYSELMKKCQKESD